MRDFDDFEEKENSMPIIYMALGVSLFILLILGIVISVNKKAEKKPPKVAIVETSTAELSTDNHSKLTADDLDIWDMYPEDETEDILSEKNSVSEEESSSSEATTETDKKENKIFIEYADGSNEWVNINPYIPKHNYDFTNLISKDQKLEYYSNGKKISSLGVELSRYHDNVDFYQLKQNGIDFVMLRVGARGYKTGELKLDENFQEHLKKASDAGLQIGLYVYSQAITVEEAEAEAQLILDQIGEFQISYPIAIDMEFVENDNSRVASLTRDERTTISAAFVNKIKEANYTAMIYGNTEWLVKRIDLSKFIDCCICLHEEKDMPDYPYQFEMWHYSQKGEVPGVEGFVNMNLSFIDYSAR